MNGKFNPYPEGTIKVIPQKEYSKLDLEHKQFLELLNQKKQLEEELQKVNTLIDKREAELLSQINTGKRFTWCWKWLFKRTNISWKTELEKVIGKKKVDIILASTEQTEYPHIGVEGFHPKPIEEEKPLKRLSLKKKG